ncbi:MAG: hypothetical protein IKP86_09920, partial [Anaerolineaceae bacterium]|nr:hypothetical protein [Anaerolineaceae bacterium]
MDFKTDNFDKEFDLNKQTAKKKGQGKLPSWLLILAGAAMIGGVVAARQPNTGTSETIPVRSVSLPAGETVSGDPLVFSGVNDEKVDSSELIAHFVSQGGNGAQYVIPLRTVGSSQAYAMELDPLELDSNGYIVPPADQSMDSSIVWVDEKPYALTILPNDEAKPAEGASSVYWLNGNPYEVTLEPLSDAELSGLKDTEMSGVVRIGNQAFRMSMRAVDPSSVKAEVPVILSPDVLPELKLSPTPETEKPALVLSPDRNGGEDAEDLPGKSVPGADDPAVVKLGEKSYSVTVRPAGEGSPASDSGEAVQTARFEMNGSTYELELKELSPESADGGLSSAILWVGDVPLQVSLTNEADSDETETRVEISLDPLPAEQTAELRHARFGEADGGVTADNDPFPAETEAP